MRILVTGTAGFIGYHLANRLIHDGHEVAGLDCINNYYDVKIKFDRLAMAGVTIPQNAKDSPDIFYQSSLHPSYRFYRLHLEDKYGLLSLFSQYQPEVVVHLAAQAGVRYSLTHPEAYIQSNIVGFANILEACRQFQCRHLIYASSSSVYGLNETMPFSTSDNVDHPISLYAASKKSNELMAHVYSHLFHLPTTGLRFFTVYGPWGRPDMALFLFTKAILQGETIQVFNHGDMVRDFTYIDDIIEGLTRIVQHVPKGNPAWSGTNPDPASSKAPYKIYNIGNNNPVKLLDFIETIEEVLAKKARKQYLPLQPGDVPATYADVSDLVEDLGYKPSTSVRDGIIQFVNWYKAYYLT